MAFFTFCICLCMRSLPLRTCCVAARALSPALTVFVSRSKLTPVLHSLSSTAPTTLHPLHCTLTVCDRVVSRVSMPGDSATHSPPTNAAPCALVHPVAEHHRLPHAPSRCHHDALTSLVQQPPQCGSFCNNPSKVAPDRGLCNRNPRSLLLPIVDVKRAEPLAQGLDHGMNPPLTWGNHRNNFIGPGNLNTYFQSPAASTMKRCCCKLYCTCLDYITLFPG
jgi:hypothetical protein